MENRQRFLENRHEKLILSSLFHIQLNQKVNYNFGHNILELYNVLVQIRLTTSKTKRDI